MRNTLSFDQKTRLSQLARNRMFQSIYGNKSMRDVVPVLIERLGFHVTESNFRLVMKGAKSNPWMRKPQRTKIIVKVDLQSRVTELEEKVISQGKQIRLLFAELRRIQANEQQ